MSVHVIPDRDEREHETGFECWCEPRVEWIDPATGLPYPGGALVVHNSADGREYCERLIGEPMARDKTWTAIEV